MLAFGKNIPNLKIGKSIEYERITIYFVVLFPFLLMILFSKTRFFKNTVKFHPGFYMMKKYKAQKAKVPWSMW